jgi:hypothetical protein
MNPITFIATGSDPITWNLTGGTMAAGLSLSTGGVLSGTPTQSGSFFFEITATNADGSDSASFTHDVGTTVTETEPNDTSAEADPIDIGTRAAGVLTADDVDYWSFGAAAGQVVRVELFAIRREHASWNANANRPRLELVGPNGTDFLVGHDFDSAGTAGWDWGDHDPDIPFFRIPATGTYFVRISPTLAATQGGIYAVVVSNVTPANLQAETESNNDAATADAITPGTVYATRVDDDDDFYSFSISAPTLVYFEVTAYRNGIFGVAGVPDDDYFDPSIELIGSDQATVLATSYQAFFSDPALHYHLVTPGTYYLRVTESIDGSDGDADYFLRFDATPVGSLAESEANDDTASADAIVYGDVVSGSIDGGDVDFFSFTGEAGDIIRVSWFEQGASEVNADFMSISLMLDDATAVQRAVSFTSVNSLAVLRAILPSSGTFYLRVTPEGGSMTYTFQLTRFRDATYETEANDTTATADPFPGSGRVAGAINSSSDADVFSFSVLVGDVVTFSVHAGPGSSSNGFPSHSRYTSMIAALLPNLQVVSFGGTVQGSIPYSASVFSGESIANGVATTELTFVALTSGTYYLRITSSNGSGDDDHRYVVERR